MRRISAILLRQVFLLRGSVARLIPLFAWVAVDMIMWGFLTRYLNSVSRATVDFVPTLLGAVLMWDFFSRVMQGVTTTFLEDVWSRSFVNLFSTPLETNEYEAGLVLCSVATSAIGLAVMLALATGLFGLSFFSFGIALIPFVLVLFVFGIAMGVFASAIVLRLGPAAEWFVWPIPAVIAPFAGVFYPVSSLPRWMQMVARGLPPSGVFESMRAMVLHQPLPASTLAWSGGLALAYLAGAWWCFNAIYRSARRTGLLARYSAENVS